MGPKVVSLQGDMQEATLNELSRGLGDDIRRLGSQSEEAGHGL